MAYLVIRKENGKKKNLLANIMHAWHLKNFTEYVSLSPWKPVI
jgi:hypothetical protein